MKKAAATIASVPSPVAAFGAPKRMLRYGAPLLLAFAVGASSWSRSCECREARSSSSSGTWSGKGKVTFEGGNSEALACTAYYVSRDAGAGLGLAIRCASTSYKTEIRSNLHHA